MNAAIEVEALSKRFGAVVALEDVSLKVEYGRVVGFLGPNGAGKSTLMRALLGLVRSDSGEAYIAGLPYAHLPAPAMSQPRIVTRPIVPVRFDRGSLDRLAYRRREAVDRTRPDSNDRAGPVLTRSHADRNRQLDLRARRQRS